MKRSKNKKGMAVISWVLLLGFAIALATTIALWQVKQTEELSEGMIRFVSGGLQCENVQFNIQAKEGCSNLEVVNNGYFDINQFVVRGFSNSSVGAIVDKTSAPVKKLEPLNVGLINAEKAEIVPVIKVSDELVGCKDKTVEVTCKGLSEIQKFICEQADPDKCDLLEELETVSQGECCTILQLCC